MTTTARNIRVDDQLWAAAGERAKAEGTTVSELIRQWLGDYTAGTNTNALAYRPKPSTDDMIDQLHSGLERLRGQLNGHTKVDA